MRWITTMLVVGATLLRPDPTGTWVGTYQTSESGGDIALIVAQSDNGWSVRLRATSEYVANPQFQQAIDVGVSGDTLRFTVTWGSPVRWVGVASGDSMRGTMTTDHWSGTWTGQRTTR